MPGWDKGLYSFNEDGMIRLQKDLNYMFTHLDDKNVRRLHTEYCQIKSEDGETEIDGPLLVMKAAGSSTIRLRMGWNPNSSEFEFVLFGSDGDPTLELDSTGDIVNRGNINTVKDIFVGNRIFLGWNGSTVLPTATLSTRGMYVMEPDTTKYMAAVYSTNTAASTDPQDYSFEIESSNPFNITARNTMNIYMYADWGGASTVGVNTTDFMDVVTINNRALFNVDGLISSTIKGTFIGSDDRDIYVTHEGVKWQNKIPSMSELESSFKDEMRYCHTHNVRFINRPTTNWTAAGGSVTPTGSTRTWSSTAPAFIYPNTTNAYSPGLQSTFASVDCSKFPDGTAITSDDYLVIVVWYYESSTTYNNSAQIHIGSGSTDRYFYSFSSGFDAGWNVQKRKVGAYDLSTGSPDFADITYMRAGFDIPARPAGLGSGYIDYVGIIRADPNDADLYNCYQRENGTTSPYRFESMAGSFTISRNNEVCIMQAPQYLAWPYDTYMAERHDFNLTVNNWVQQRDMAPVLAAYANSQNWIQLSVSSGVMRLQGLSAGTTFGDYKNCEAFSQYTYTEMGLKRYDSNNWRGWFRSLDNPESYREISFYNICTTQHDIVGIYLGNNDNDQPCVIRDINITPHNVLGLI